MAVPDGAEARAHCGQRITHNFTLGRNLQDCRGNGLVVRASNIKIKLTGHTIDGRRRSNTAGIQLTGVHGVTVQGGVIRQFGRGIWLVRSDDDKILSNRVSGSVDEGIFTNESSARPLIKGNSVSWSGTHSRRLWADGIDARGDGVAVVGNSIRHSFDDGIDVGGEGSTIRGNRVYRSGQDGIDVDSRGSLVQGNVSTVNGDDGIGVGRGASSVTVAGNVANTNADLGIQPISGTAIDGGGNHASANGDARQCVRIICVP
ncbi:MAG: right-handed parallel beta-helix repeat-containing protein [Nocardioidaceae bacterium]